jgi:hypothetical protein
LAKTADRKDWEEEEKRLHFSINCEISGFWVKNTVSVTYERFINLTICSESVGVAIGERSTTQIHRISVVFISFQLLQQTVEVIMMLPPTAQSLADR